MSTSCGPGGLPRGFNPLTQQTCSEYAKQQTCSEYVTQQACSEYATRTHTFTRMRITRMCTTQTIIHECMLTYKHSNDKLQSMIHTSIRTCAQVAHAPIKGMHTIYTLLQSVMHTSIRSIRKCAQVTCPMNQSRSCKHTARARSQTTCVRGSSRHGESLTHIPTGVHNGLQARGYLSIYRQILICSPSTQPG